MGLTLRDIEERTGISNAAISMWENARRMPRLDEFEKTLVALELTGDDRERLLGLRREAEGPGQLVAGATTIGPQLAKLIEQEQSARRITEVAPLLIPGLLQTSAYARVILDGESDVDTRVMLRMGRRDILTRSRNPVELLALIDVEVLTRSIAPPDVLADQLRFLLEMGARDNITIQVVPERAGLYTPLLAGPFILLEFPSASPIVHLEHYRASASLWEPEDVEKYTQAAQRITEIAMTPERTSEVIADLVNGMERGHEYGT